MSRYLSRGALSSTSFTPSIVFNAPFPTDMGRPTVRPSAGINAALLAKGVELGIMPQRPPAKVTVSRPEAEIHHTADPDDECPSAWCVGTKIRATPRDYDTVGTIGGLLEAARVLRLYSKSRIAPVSFAEAVAGSGTWVADFTGAFSTGTQILGVLVEGGRTVLNRAEGLALSIRTSGWGGSSDLLDRELTVTYYTSTGAECGGGRLFIPFARRVSGQTQPEVGIVTSWSSPSITITGGAVAATARVITGAGTLLNEMIASARSDAWYS